MPVLSYFLAVFGIYVSENYYLNLFDAMLEIYTDSVRDLVMRSC